MSRENPFVGPKPFDTADEQRFFGRNTESNQLVAMITAGPVVLLYADSGAGKTSLLRAKIIPMLRREACEIIGPARVGGVPVNQHGNPYTGNAILSLTKSTKARTLTEYLHNLKPPAPEQRPKDAKRVALRPPRVLMIDQFEELFTSSAEWWPYRDEFFADLGNALDGDPRLRVVIGMREEYIAGLDPYAPLIPGALRQRYRLERLRENSAIAAIEGPIARTDVNISRDTILALIRKLRTQGNPDVLSEFIEPLHLQVVCSRIWESLNGANVISTEMVHKAGNVDDALMSYYESSIKSVAAETKEPEGAIRLWFERELITDGKTRGIVFCGEQKAGSLRREIVKKLEDKYLVRAEYRGGARWYELSHDRMIPPVIESGRRWRDLPSSALINRLESLAEEWMKKGQPKEQLLDLTDIKTLEQWKRTKAAEDYVWTSQLKELVQASQLAQQQSATRRMRIQVAIFAVALLISSLFAYYALQQKKKADSATWQTEFKVASTFIEPRKYFYALAWSTDAYAKARKQQHTLTNDELDVFRKASAAIGDDTWLRPSIAAEVAGFSRNGRYALTTGKGQVCFWDQQHPETWRHQCFMLPSGAPAAAGAGNSFDDNYLETMNYITDDGSVGVLVTGRPTGFRSQSQLRILTPAGVITSTSSLLDFSIARNRSVIAYATRENMVVRYLQTGKKIVIQHKHDKWLPTFGSPGITLSVSPTGEWLAVLERLPGSVMLTAYDLKETPPLPTVIVDSKRNTSRDEFSWIGFSKDGLSLHYSSQFLGTRSKNTNTTYVVGTWQPTKWPEDFIVATSTNPPRTIVARRNMEGSIEKWLGEEIGTKKPAVKLAGAYADADYNTLLLHNASESLWTVWKPLKQWFPASTFTRPKEFGSIRLAAPDRFYAISEGAVRVFPFPNKLEKTNLTADELFSRACGQLRWQQEWEVVKDVCPSK